MPPLCIPSQGPPIPSGAGGRSGSGLSRGVCAGRAVPRGPAWIWPRALRHGGAAAIPAALWLCHHSLSPIFPFGVMSGKLLGTKSRAQDCREGAEGRDPHPDHHPSVLPLLSSHGRPEAGMKGLKGFALGCPQAGLGRGHRFYVNAGLHRPGDGGKTAGGGARPPTHSGGHCPVEPPQLPTAQSRVHSGLPPARRDGEGGWNPPKGAAGLSFAAQLGLGAPKDHG